MTKEIDQLLNRQRKPLEETEENTTSQKKSRIGKLPDINQDLLADEE